MTPLQGRADFVVVAYALGVAAYLGAAYALGVAAYLGAAARIEGRRSVVDRWWVWSW